MRNWCRTAAVIGGLGLLLPIVTATAASAAAPTTLVLQNQLSSVTGLPVLYPGHDETYVLTVMNMGPTTLLDGATLIDDIPVALPLAGLASVAVLPPGASASCTTVAQRVQCTLNNLTVGSSIAIHVPVSVPRATVIGTNISNRADLTSPQMPGVQAVISSNDVGPFPTDIRVTIGDLDLAAGTSGSIPVTVTNLTVGEITLVPVTTRVTIPATSALVLSPPVGCSAVAVPPIGFVAFDCVTPTVLAANAPVLFTFGVSAGADASASQTATVSASTVATPSIFDPIMANNTASAQVRVGPKAVNDAVSTNPGVAINNSVLANDRVASGATFVRTSSTANGSLTFNADGSYLYTPNPGFSGTDSFAYSVTNPGLPGFVANATVNISVRPGAADDVVFAPYGTVAAGTVATNDVYAANAVFSVVTPPGNGTFVLNANGTYTFTAAVGFSGIVEATYRVTNPDGSSTTAKLTIHVGPKANGGRLALEPGVPTTANFATDLGAGADIYAQGATFSKNGEPANGTVVVHPDGTFTYTPKPGYSGADQVPYTITNPGGMSSSNVITITVRPKANDDSFTVTQPGPLVPCNVTTNDIVANGATFTLTTGTSHGTATVNSDGSCTYQPTAGYAGPDSFTYLVRNPDGTTSSATVTIQVRKGGSLPATGSRSTSQAWLALGLLVVGAALVRSGRTRRPSFLSQ